MKSLLQARYNLINSHAHCYPRGTAKDKNATTKATTTYSGSFREGEWAGQELERHYKTGTDDEDHTYSFRGLRKPDGSPLVPPGDPHICEAFIYHHASSASSFARCHSLIDPHTPMVF